MLARAAFPLLASLSGLACSTPPPLPEQTPVAFWIDQLNRLDETSWQAREPILAELASDGQEACEPLLVSLADHRCQVRLAAAEALSAIQRLQRPYQVFTPQTPELSAAFERLAESDDPELKAIFPDAVQVPYRPDPVAAGALAGALSDPDPESRRSAASELARLHYPEAVPALIRALGDDDRWVRIWAGSALGESVLPQDRRRIVDALTQAFPLERDAVVRTVLARSLWSSSLYPDSLEAVPTLVSALRDDSAHVRCAAVGALGRMRAEREAPEPALRPAISPLIERLDDSDRRVRQETYPALAQFGGDAKRAVPRSLELMPEGSTMTLAAVLGPAKAAREVVPLLDSPHAPTRAAAARALGWWRADGSGVVSALIRALHDQDAGVRAGAASSLGFARPSTDAVPVLLQATFDPDASVRSTAMFALGHHGVEARSAMPRLLDALDSSSSVERRAAANAIGGIGVESKPVIAKLLAMALHDPDPDLGVVAVGALVRFRSAPSTKALIQVIAQGTGEARKGALWYLTTRESTDRLRGTPEARALQEVMEAESLRAAALPEAPAAPSPQP